MRTLFWLLSAVVAVGLGWLLVVRLMEAPPAPPGMAARTRAVTPVEVAVVAVGPMRDTSFFSGTLEAPERFTVSTKVAGRVLELKKDIGDPVKRGDLVAVLDDDEYRQAVLQAEAELAVRTANVNLAKAEFEVSERELAREKELHARGVSALAAYDRVEVARTAKAALLRVAESMFTRGKSELDLARTRHDYTRIHAEWGGTDDETRYVGERRANVGDTLRAHDVICTIVQLDRLTAVIYVTERDYTKLRIGSPVSLWTDAWPGRMFSGTVKRVPPELLESSREARVEVEVPNADHALKPGMFVRASIEFGRKDKAAVVPNNALTPYNGREGVFLAEASSVPIGGGEPVWKARFVPVRRGYEERPLRGAGGIGRVEVVEPGNFRGLVVTVGQHLLADGGTISFEVPAASPAAEGGKASAWPGVAGETAAAAPEAEAEKTAE